MTEYPKQPPAQDGWPTQPPRYTASPDGQPGYGHGYPQPGHGQTSYGQTSYGRSGYDPEGEAGYQDRYGQRAPRRRRRGRGWIALLVTLIVLAVLFFVGDQIAKAYAQNMIAGKLQSQSDLATRPSVTIEGFPFLTQVAAHDIRTVDISASNVQAGKLDITSVKATATGVHLNSSFNGATIDQISGSALISFDSLVNATGAQGVTVTADPAGGPNAANVNLGPLTATARITQTGPSQITVTIQSLNGLTGSLLGSLPDYKINVPKLPAGLQVRGVSVTNQGIVIKVAARDTTLSQ